MNPLDDLIQETILDLQTYHNERISDDVTLDDGNGHQKSVRSPMVPQSGDNVAEPTHEFADLITLDENPKELTQNEEVSVDLEPPGCNKRKIDEIDEEDPVDYKSTVYFHRSGKITLSVPDGHPTINLFGSKVFALCSSSSQISPLKLSTPEQLQDLNERIQDDQYRLELLTSLWNLGGKNNADKLRRILRFVMTDECAVHFNWIGSNRKGSKCNKQSFESLKNVTQLILDAAIKSIGYEETELEKLLEDSQEMVKGWLKSAPGRIEAKKKAFKAAKKKANSCQAGPSSVKPEIDESDG